ncbi:MAG TPA: zinc ribbon domain-containing protein [Ktedonobacterales bacterium]
MQQTFCTNCGQPLAAGSAFCGNCGARQGDATPQAPYPTAPSAPQYSQVPGSFGPSTQYSGPSVPATPVAAPPAPAKSGQGNKWLVGCAGGCLFLFVAFVAGVIGALVYGITNRQIVYIAIGLAGIALVFLTFNFIWHVVRRHFQAQFGGGPTAQRYPQQRRRPVEAARPHPSHFGFFFLLLAAAAGLYFGLPFYYTHLYTGSWSGTLTVGGAQEGVYMTLGVTVPSLLSHEPNGVAATFNTTTAQACKAKGGQDSYQVTGTASNFDAATISMTFTNPTSKASFTLEGSFKNQIFTLAGDSGTTPVTLTMQRGTQSDFTTTCQGLGLGGEQTSQLTARVLEGRLRDNG